MPAEHIRPTGLAQGYFCYVCGMHCNMVGTGHGSGLCEPNPGLVNKLIELNREDSNLRRIAEESDAKRPPLGALLAKTIDELEAAKVKGLEEKAAADLEKIRKERQDLYNFVYEFRQYAINAIVTDKVPAKKVKSYDRQEWIRTAVKGAAKHQDAWDSLRTWAREEGLTVVAHEGHDGVGIESWITLTVEPVRRGTRGD